MRQVDIKGFERYQITDDGRVWSKISNKYLAFKKHVDGYLRVTLCGTDGLKKTIGVHRLVAEAFIPNPNNLPQVNHKDENPDNNNYSNLEWCSVQYNNTYGNRIAKAREKKLNHKNISKEVFQYSLDDKLIATYPSIHEVIRQNPTFVKQGIMIACHGGQMRKNKWVNSMQYKGYKWKYSLI